MEFNTNQFSTPPDFSFSPHDGDQVCQVTLGQNQLQREADKRYQDIEKTVQQMVLDDDEVKQTSGLDFMKLNNICNRDR